MAGERRDKSARSTRSVLERMERVAKAERAFLGQEFLAPVLRGGGVRVRIAGVVCQLTGGPRGAAGWLVLRAELHTLARPLRPATMAERRRYLELLPALSLVLVDRRNEEWASAPASQSDSRFQIEGAVPLHLAEDVDLFDTVRARFDGGAFWFEEADPRADPAAAAYLRQSLIAMLDPARVARPGLTAEQRAAYAFVHAARRRAEAEARAREEAARRTASEGRVRDALAHAGADLRDFTERGGAYRVTYVVDGRRHTSIVDKRDLTVQTAGICLSGGDRNFDLHSLVGVIREGEAGRSIRRMT